MFGCLPTPEILAWTHVWSVANFNVAILELSRHRTVAREEVQFIAQLFMRERSL